MTVELVRCRVCGRTDFDGLRGRRIHEANQHGLKVVRHPTRPFGEHPQTQEATIRVTTRLLEWAAGYLEGEGCFSLREHPAPRKPGFEVTAGSTDKEPLQILLAIFGGKLCERKRASNAKRPHMWYWATYGVRALGVAMTLYPLLCPRRQAKIRDMLDVARTGYARATA